MSSSGLDFASEYFIDSIILKSDVNGKEYQLLHIFSSIEIYESMTHTFIYGKINIEDTNGLIEILPIIGEEKISFKLRKKSSDKKYFKVVGNVFKISDRIRPPERKGIEQYTLEFITEGALENQTKRVSKTYEGKVSEAIKDIAEKHLNLKKVELDDLLSKTKNFVEENKNLYEDVLIEDTMEENKINVPNLKPVDAINFLTKFCYSQNGGDKNPYNTSFKFYQTRQGYFFQSVEQTIKQRKEKIRQEYSFSNDPNLKSGSQQVKKEDLFTVIDYQFVNLYDNFSASSDGYYGGTNFSYDTLTKTLHEHKLNYNQKFKELVHIDNNNTNTDNFNLNKNPEKSIIKSFPTRKGSNESQYIKDHTSKDIFYGREDEIDILKIIKNERFNEGIIMEINIPANQYLYIGDIVNLKFPSYIREKNKKEYLDDKYFSGKYMVISITHKLSNIELKTWEMNVTLLKDSYKDKIK